MNLYKVVSVLIFCFISSKKSLVSSTPFIIQNAENESQLTTNLEKVEPASLQRFIALFQCVTYVYTRANPDVPDVIYKGFLQSVTASHFDFGKPVKVIIHGWNSDYKQEVNTIITNAFLQAADVNVLVIDWSAGANGIYLWASSNVFQVGAYVGSLINWLVWNGVPINNFHVIGHSLGVHVAGIAGRLIVGGSIPYITGLDPALPLWGAGSSRIRKTDGKYVEIIHTNAGTLALRDPVGTTDFYPNGGINQPGCNMNSACDHSRSYLYFAYSIDNQNFMGSKCNSVDELQNGNCANLGQLYMGGIGPKNGDGIYYLQTTSAPPFY